MMAAKQKNKINSQRRKAKDTVKTLRELPKDPMDVVFDTKNFK